MFSQFIKFPQAKKATEQVGLRWAGESDGCPVAVQLLIFRFGIPFFPCPITFYHTPRHLSILIFLPLSTLTPARYRALAGLPVRGIGIG
jgi:hypothetical protein